MAYLTAILCFKMWPLFAIFKTVSSFEYYLFLPGTFLLQQVLRLCRDFFRVFLAILCRGYSPCKILSLDQKIKLPKTCEKRLYKHIRVVLCKKPAPKNSKYSKNESILKMAKNGHNAKAIAHAKYSVWINK